MSDTVELNHRHPSSSSRQMQRRTRFDLSALREELEKNGDL
jgi:hypothetical protein